MRIGNRTGSEEGVLTADDLAPSSGGSRGQAVQGTIKIDARESVPDWEPYLQPVAPQSAPNVLYIVLDDVGFSAMEPWGGLIETPNINRLASSGLTYTNWHTTALCSPTRSSLLTGRNHTTNGMACIAEATSGFPNANGHIPFECATIAEVLGERGWNTYMLGKWHLCPADEMNMASTKRNWPLGRGFERPTASSAGRPTSGIRIWCMTTTRSSNPAGRRRATT
jgi:arylsulfatase